MRDKYLKQVKTLIEILPIALTDNRMALKGGTAINLFHRDLPRLSVDIDLCYLPLEDRVTTFTNIHKILLVIKEELEKKLGAEVTANFKLDGKKEAKLRAVIGGIEIKIEPNFTIRGSVFDPVSLPLSVNTSKQFGRSLKVNCLSVADTYGGKICAALDRQHPRDLFDVKFLLENEGITEEVKDSFLFYLTSHNRPINEVLDPRLKDITDQYHSEFVQMSFTEVTQEELEETRVKLIEAINKSLSDNDKKFLISFVSNTPEWELLTHPKIQDFPSVKWKLFNQGKMKEKALTEYVESVQKVLGLI